MKRPSILTEIMAEHIHMPGFPQLVVTRGFVYQWLKSQGWSPSERGYGSLDYATFGPSAITEPLADMEVRDEWLAEVAEGYAR